MNSQTLIEKIEDNLTETKYLHIYIRQTLIKWHK